jgi:hypothetical protein
LICPSADKLASLYVAHNKKLRTAAEIEEQKKNDPYLPVMHPWACCVLPDLTAYFLDGRHSCLWRYNHATGTKLRGIE